MTNFTILRSIVLTIIAFLSFLTITGCDESGIDPELGGGDSNVVIYRNVEPLYQRWGMNDTSYIGVDLLYGELTLGLNTSKDMILIDWQSTYEDFYFRSGDMSDEPEGGDFFYNGKETRFYFIPSYGNVSQAQFDTMSVIPDTDEFLEPEDFTSNMTSDFMFMNPNQYNRPVFFFYLKGKYEAGQTNGKRVYGMIYVKDMRYTNNPEEGVIATLDIKLNKNGENKFIKYPESIP